MRSETTSPGSRRGLTLTEIMAVIGILVILLAILLPGLATIRRTGEQTTSESNLRQLFTYIKSYMTDNREFIPPSSFDYRDSGYPGTVRTNSPRNATPNSGPVEGGEFEVSGGFEHVGSWADIIWSYSDQSPILDVNGPPGIGASSYNYRYDSPDRWVFESIPEFKTTFRSTALNTRAVEGTGATPFGNGTVVAEKGQPGYFAANDWFAVEANSGRWISGPQVRFPGRSIYLVDSYAGETIAPTDEGWGDPSQNIDTQVDFRYIGDNALFLTLDGGISVEGSFESLEDVEDRGFRVHDLDKRVTSDHDHEGP